MKAGTLITGAFVAQGAVDGAKKTIGELKAPKANKYDIKLNNQSSTTLDNNGNVVKNAHQTIDDLFDEKVAYEKNNYNSKHRDDYNGKYTDYKNKIKNEQKEKEKKNTRRAIGAMIGTAAITHAIAKKNPLAPFRAAKEGAKQFGYDAPKLLSKKVRGFKVAYNAAKAAAKTSGTKTKKIKPSEVNEKLISGLGWGAGAGAGSLAFHMIGEKYFDKDGKNDKTIKKSFKESVPDPTIDVYDKYQANIHNSKRRPDKYSTDNRRTYTNGYYNKYDNRHYNKSKEASELLEQLYIEKTAKISANEAINTGKKLFHEDVLQNSIKSLPYYLMPLSVGYAINKDLRSDGRPLRGKKAKPNQVVIEIPTESLNKTAAVRKFKVNKKVFSDAVKDTPKKFDVKESWKKFGKEGLPASLLKSLSWTIPVTALTAITGRNLRGRGEKMDDQNIAPGKTRITIETNPAYKNRDDTFVNASEELDAIYKEASDDIKKNRNPRLKTRVNHFLKSKGLMKMQNLDVLSTIMRAAMQQKTVEITYTDSKGVVTTRETEPYEVKNGKYWGFDVAKQQIRQFNLENVSGATQTNKTYAPRWPVKIS